MCKEISFEEKVGKNENNVDTLKLYDICFGSCLLHINLYGLFNAKAKLIEQQ